MAALCGSSLTRPLRSRIYVQLGSMKVVFQWHLNRDGLHECDRVTTRCVSVGARLARTLLTPRCGQWEPDTGDRETH